LGRGLVQHHDLREPRELCARVPGPAERNGACPPTRFGGRLRAIAPDHRLPRRSPSATKGATVAQLATGMVVRHSTLGIGRVVASQKTAIHVFFAGAERREAAKLWLGVAEPFLQPDPDARDERLDDLPRFVLDPHTGRYSPERSREVSARKTSRR
ncbi:MAG TPA: hypothetical protein VMK12_08065, partial [Anaeromyxobacteraceae bacterium]|nr:hypothetical protein [Anaeromyxobacteraceae bacterium]